MLRRLWCCRRRVSSPASEIATTASVRDDANDTEWELVPLDGCPAQCSCDACVTATAMASLLASTSDRGSAPIRRDETNERSGPRALQDVVERITTTGLQPQAPRWVTDSPPPPGCRRALQDVVERITFSEPDDARARPRRNVAGANACAHCAATRPRSSSPSASNDDIVWVNWPGGRVWHRVQGCSGATIQIPLADAKAVGYQRACRKCEGAGS